MKMDSSFNYRHAQIHEADLHRRAERHRLAAQARNTQRETRPETRSLLAPPGLIETVRATLARLAATRPLRP
jgi:hypothetical protein